MILALALVAAALLLPPLYLVALAVVRLLDRVDGTVHVRPASDAATPPTTPRARTKTLASPAARRERATAEPYADPHPPPDSSVVLVRASWPFPSASLVSLDAIPGDWIELTA